MGRPECRAVDFILDHPQAAIGVQVKPAHFFRVERARANATEDGDLAAGFIHGTVAIEPNGHRIYALNRARANHGLTDTNLTLLPVRSAIVLNSLFEREMFQIRDELCPVNWG